MLDKRQIASIILLIIILVLSLAFYIAGTSSIKNLNEVNTQFKKQLKENENTIKNQEEKIKEIQEKNSKLKVNFQKVQEEYNELQEEYNKLNSKYKEEIEPLVFNEWDLRTPSNSTDAKLNRALSNTNLAGLEQAYLKAEETYGVNAVFLIALTAEESGWGSSKRALEQNNLSGYAVYSDGSKGKSFSSKEDSIMATAKLISQEYLNLNGSYHLGVSIKDVNKSYCPVNGFTWSENIKDIANEILGRVNK